MNSVQRFDETKLPDEKDFYSTLKTSILVSKIVSLLLEFRMNLK